MIFFIDENISEYAGYMLDNFDRENEIRVSVKYFDKGTADTKWMPTVASWGKDTVAVCGDGRILKNEAEKRVLKECGLMFVHLAAGWTNLKWNDFAWKIIKAWPDIVRNVNQVKHPMVFEVAIGGKIHPRGRIASL